MRRFPRRAWPKWPYPLFACNMAKNRPDTFDLSVPLTWLGGF
jgi:hypothetical protein